MSCLEGRKKEKKKKVVERVLCKRTTGRKCASALEADQLDQWFMYPLKGYVVPLTGEIEIDRSVVQDKALAAYGISGGMHVMHVSVCIVFFFE